MKYFSSLIAFVMIFACFSVAYADVAPYPRPRPDSRPRPLIQRVTADVTADNKLSLEFRFSAACDYEYQLIHQATGNEIYSSTGEYDYDLGNVDEVVNLDNFLTEGQNYLLLKIRCYNIKEQTRFGSKIKRDKLNITKTLVISKDSDGKITNVRVYNGEQSRR